MTRTEFTEKLARLILRMRTEGEDPILDYVKRSEEEQWRLFQSGLSKCDGFRKKSTYQFGRAADIYFLDPGGSGSIGPPIKGHEYWHDVWEEMGGKDMIDWDRGYFEG